MTMDKTNLESMNLDRIELIQNRLASALIRQAKNIGVSAKDWVQGGWSRSSDKIDFGVSFNEMPNITLER